MTIVRIGSRKVEEAVDGHWTQWDEEWVRESEPTCGNGNSRRAVLI